MEHQAIILLGSNIDPLRNMQQAFNRLKELTHVQSVSSVWETQAVGSNGPNFLNAAVLISSPLDQLALKSQILNRIENELGRVRTSDKNAPRTIDLDVIIFDDIILDDNLWERVHIAQPVAELLPDLMNPITGETLMVASQRMHQSQLAFERQALSI